MTPLKFTLEIYFFYLHSNNHHPAFGHSHALSMLGNFMGVPNLQNIQNLQHSDVLEKLKMQVGLMDPDFSLHSLRNLSTPPNTSFTLPQSGVGGTGSAIQPQNLTSIQATQQNSFSFTPPNAPHTKDGNFHSNAILVSPYHHHPCFI